MSDNMWSFFYQSKLGFNNSYLQLFSRNENAKFKGALITEYLDCSLCSVERGFYNLSSVKFHTISLLNIFTVWKGKRMQIVYQ